jgi:hypothetical protein
MNKDFEFKQLLRAYRSGIISEGAFELEMKHLENGNGAHSSNDAGSFKAFGQSYSSERAAIVAFLENASAAETNGGDAVRTWLGVCKTECIRGGLNMVAERESYHGRTFERRVSELGGKMGERDTPEFRKQTAYLRNPDVSDFDKLKRGVVRFPNPEETIRPLFEFAESIKEDFQTKEMVRLFAEDELSTLKWQHSIYTTLSAMMNTDAKMSAA